MATKTARLVARNVAPLYAHDCPECRFVGRLDGQDLYHCPEDGSYVRRFGSEPHENGSVGDFVPEGSAYSLARELVRRGVWGNEYRTEG